AIERSARVLGEGAGQGFEGFAVADALIESLDQLRGFGLAADLAGLDQDMTHIEFIHQQVVPTALVEQLEDVETHRRAQRWGDAADFQAVHRIGKLGRQLCCLAPTQLTALQGMLTAGPTDSQAGEVGTFLQLAVDLFGHLGLTACLLVARGFRHGQYYHGQAIVRRGLITTHLAIQEVAYFLITDLDALGNPALADPVDDRFPADLLAGVTVADAVSLQGGTERLEGNAAALGQLLQGLIQGSIIDLDAGPFTHLQLNAFQDQPVHYLLADLFGRWQLAAAALTELGADAVDPFLHLTVHDDIVVDDGHHPVQLDHLRLQAGADQQTGAQADQFCV